MSVNVSMNNDTNGTLALVSSSSGITLNSSQLIQALNLIYEPRTPNETRKEATAFLEQAKVQNDAPAVGFILASDGNQPATTRHFGLSLLEFPIRYRWDDFDSEQTRLLRRWVMQLAEEVEASEPLYFRNKIAQLWVDIAERSWTVDWRDMDDTLCQMWQGNSARQELVLHVLETLSETVFSPETSPVSPSKPADLGRACVQIFLSSTMLHRVLPESDLNYVKKCGEEGWLQRLLVRLESCLAQGVSNGKGLNTFVTEILTVLQTVMPWILLKAITGSSCVELLCRCLDIGDTSIQLVSRTCRTVQSSSITGNTQ